jgi:hypothetical protein
VIGFLAAAAMKLGVAERFAKPAGMAGAAILLLLAAWVLKSCYDARLIERHEAGQRAATAKADRKADTKAAEQRRADDTRLATETRQLEKSREADTDLDRRLARHRCLRLQQAARAGGREPPACD